MTDAVGRHKTVVPGPLLPAKEPELSEFLAFTLASETYALPLAAVREILKPPPVTPVPRARADVLGVISVRGVITTVIDLRRRLRLPEAGQNRHMRVLLVDSGGEVLGVLVDSVLSVYRLAEDEMELAAVVGGDLAEHVMGIGRPRTSRLSSRETTPKDEGREELLILLDPAPLLKR